MDFKLLFVDDERAILNGIERLLGFDYDLDTAESGKEALETIANNGPYDIIFTDMRMPAMDGLQFVAEARKIAPASTFIMLTGNTDKETFVKAMHEARVFRFLNKPCDAGTLQLAIADAAEQGGQATPS
ncbi:Transcriptional regulatory protein QseF [Posidoniimonas polymericola]|uniref:Transcriptional regulatory protein QseF n=1 Tax=Posidoniimonas polymericola TaxID=2528002 RepID=A0A5C5YQZ3_9BACT|nr:response regulator [Posidoniimonas polymericola]TWT77283.1 Transcriptional regulatory protein QseF [Posidoniimonas polymericola]